MTVADLITLLQSAPQDAVPVDSDDLEVVKVIVSPDGATVKLWTEQK